jgi:hypothetical protein
MVVLDSWFPFIDVTKTLDKMDRVFNRVGWPLACAASRVGPFRPSIFTRMPPALVAEMPGIASGGGRRRGGRRGALGAARAADTRISLATGR